MLCPARGATTIAFEPAALPGGSRLISSYDEQGFSFNTPNGLISNDISNGLFPHNGAAYVEFAFGQSPLTITTSNSQPFNLLRVDLAEYSTVFATPKTIVFMGLRLDNTMTSAIFTIDGVIDGNGPLNDFQTFSFPASFTNLTQVTVNTEAYAMDNLQATVVPEPGIGTLILLTLGAGWMRARGKASRKMKFQ